MTNVAFAVDILLYFLFAFSVALCVFKGIDLWTTKLDKNISFASMEEFIIHKERGLTWLSIIASVGPFIGLVGTVMHIIVALQKIGESADMAVISGPIATALVSTLVGLCAAIPALVVYNLAQRKLFLIEAAYIAEDEENE